MSITEMGIKREKSMLEEIIYVKDKPRNKKKVTAPLLLAVASALVVKDATQSPSRVKEEWSEERIKTTPE